MSMSRMRPRALSHSAFDVRRSVFGVCFFTWFQIASNSTRSASPSFLPRTFSSSSTLLNRWRNLSVAFWRADSASMLHLRARFTTAKSKSPISSSISDDGELTAAG